MSKPQAIVLAATVLLVLPVQLWAAVAAPTPLDDHQIEIDGAGRATLFLPLELGGVTLDAQAGPIELQSVRYAVHGERLSVTLSVSNPSDRDREVLLQATLLDDAGNPMANEADRREVEEGECGKLLTVQWELSPAELAAAASVRVAVSSWPD